MFSPSVSEPRPAELPPNTAGRDTATVATRDVERPMPTHSHQRVLRVDRRDLGMLNILAAVHPSDKSPTDRQECPFGRPGAAGRIWRSIGRPVVSSRFPILGSG